MTKGQEIVGRMPSLCYEGNGWRVLRYDVAALAKEIDAAIEEAVANAKRCVGATAGEIVSDHNFRYDAAQNPTESEAVNEETARQINQAILDEREACAAAVETIPISASPDLAHSVGQIHSYMFAAANYIRGRKKTNKGDFRQWMEAEVEGAEKIAKAIKEAEKRARLAQRAYDERELIQLAVAAERRACLDIANRWGNTDVVMRITERFGCTPIASSACPDVSFACVAPSKQVQAARQEGAEWMKQKVLELIKLLPDKCSEIRITSEPNWLDKFRRMDFYDAIRDWLSSENVSAVEVHTVVRKPACYVCTKCGEAHGDGDGFVGKPCPRRKA